MSPAYEQLGPTTRQIYRRILEGLREEHGHRLVKDLQRKHIIALHNAKAATPAAANSLLELLRGLIRPERRTRAPHRRRRHIR